MMHCQLIGMGTVGNTALLYTVCATRKAMLTSATIVRRHHNSGSTQNQMAIKRKTQQEIRFLAIVQ